MAVWVTTSIYLSHAVLARLRQLARRRGMTPERLAAQVLHDVVAGRLVEKRRR